MKTNTSHHHLLAAAVMFSLCLSQAKADFTTSFETSSGYTAGGVIVGVHDQSAPAGNLWTTVFNSSAITAASDNPASGSLSLKIADASTSTAYGTQINLGDSVDFTNAFTVDFSVAITGISGAGSVAQVYLGSQTAAATGSQRYWAALTIATDGNIYLVSDNAAGNGVVTVGMGSYQSYVGAGSYLDVSISIDPLTRKYTHVSFAGTDKTSTILSSVSGGMIPALHATAGTPGSYLSFVAGTGSAGTILIDDLAITGSIPEPSAYAATVAALAGMCALGRRVRIQKGR